MRVFGARMRVFRFRRSRRQPPCRRPASNQPSHATSVCRLVTRLSPLPLLPSTSCTTPLSDLPRLVRLRRRRRRLLLRSRRQPPCRCPASNQPSHATSVCRLVTRLSPLPLLPSTSCTTPLSDLPRLVRPRRRRLRPLRLSRRRPPCCRPASTQPSHATFMRRLVTRLLLLHLQGCTTRPTSTPRARATTPSHASDAADPGVLLGPGASTSGTILERLR